MMKFYKEAIPGLFFYIFVFSIRLTVNVQYKFLPTTAFGPLELEATALPTELQPRNYFGYNHCPIK